MPTKDARVAIIGGGATALWLAHDAASSNLECKMFSEQPLAAYSSTRNQGWLQSGALYAMHRDPETAIACFQGAFELAAFCPEAVSTEVPCFYFFENETEAQDAHKLCATAGIAVEVELATAVSARIGLDRIRHQCEFAVRGPDRRMDAARILAKASREAYGLGVEFIHADLRSVHINDSGNEWAISLGGNPPEPFDVVILACGPLINVVLANSGVASAHLYEPTKIGVLAVTGVRVGAMLVWMTGVGPNVVPFAITGNPNRARVQGYTACLSQGDVSAPTLDEQLDPGQQQELERHVELRYGLPIRSPRVHLCHKVSRIGSNEARGISMEKLDRGLLYVYPGKFTTARIAARMALNALEINGVPIVERQPYAR